MRKKWNCLLRFPFRLFLKSVTFFLVSTFHRPVPYFVGEGSLVSAILLWRVSCFSPVTSSLVCSSTDTVDNHWRSCNQIQCWYKKGPPTPPPSCTQWPGQPETRAEGLESWRCNSMDQRDVPHWLRWGYRHGSFRWSLRQGGTFGGWKAEHFDEARAAGCGRSSEEADLTTCTAQNSLDPVDQCRSICSMLAQEDYPWQQGRVQ